MNIVDFSCINFEVTLNKHKSTHKNRCYKWLARLVVFMPATFSPLGGQNAHSRKKK